MLQLYTFHLSALSTLSSENALTERQVAPSLAFFYPSLPFWGCSIFLQDAMPHFALSSYKQTLRLLSCFPIPELAKYNSNQGIPGSPGETFCLLTFSFSLLPSQESLILPALSFFSLNPVFLKRGTDSFQSMLAFCLFTFSPTCCSSLP